VPSSQKEGEQQFAILFDLSNVSPRVVYAVGLRTGAHIDAVRPGETVLHELCS
jgi:hypothetical protein